MRRMPGPGFHDRWGRHRRLDGPWGGRLPAQEKVGDSESEEDPGGGRKWTREANSPTGRTAHRFQRGILPPGPGLRLQTARHARREVPPDRSHPFPTHPPRVIPQRELVRMRFEQRLSSIAQRGEDLRAGLGHFPATGAGGEVVGHLVADFPLQPGGGVGGDGLLQFLVIHSVTSSPYRIPEDRLAVPEISSLLRGRSLRTPPHPVG